MPCALRQLRAACAQLRRRYYGSVCLRLRLEARRSHRQTPPRGSGAHHRFCGHLRRNPRNPDHSGDYSRNYGLNRATDGFSCSREVGGVGGQHTWIYYLIPELRMMAAAADGSSSCGFRWIIGAPPLSRCRDRTSGGQRIPAQAVTEDGTRAKTSPPYFAVDFDRGTGIFWDVLSR